ncbi:MAG: acyl carrier protein [Pseudomonadota bacterium]
MTAHADIRSWLRDWVAETSGEPVSSFDDETALFADGLLDSTDFVELLLVIEERTGRPVDLARFEPNAFASINAMTRHLFAETSYEPSLS